MFSVNIPSYRKFLNRPLSLYKYFLLSVYAKHQLLYQKFNDDPVLFYRDDLFVRGLPMKGDTNHTIKELGI